MIYGYARCSTNEQLQDINRQVRELKQQGAVDDTIYREYESGIEICHYCIYKLYSLKECGIEKGKTTIDDIKPYFPFDDFDFNLEYLEYLTEENEPLLIELQFREGEYQLGFAKKGGNYVLDHIGGPFLTLSVAQSILPKDLALITDN